MSGQEIGTQILFPLVLGTVMFGLGLALQWRDFWQVVRFPKAAAIGLAGQIILLPLGAFVLLSLYPFPALVAGGLIILSACPGGAVSNAIVFVARGDVALSVSLTALSSVVTIFTIPLIVGVGMAQFADVDARLTIGVVDTLRQLGAMILAPMAAGMLVRFLWPGFAVRAERIFRLLAIVLVLLMFVAGAFVADGVGLADVELALLGVAGLIAIVLPLGFLLAKAGRLTQAQSMTVMVEIGVQNAATGYVVAGTLLGQPDMILAIGIYGLLMFAAAGIAILAARRGFQRA
ncbi:MAG TPA: bile acid:sodium symporter [Alphaproteobacteria bacterium]|jgi:BASS family bile acid:Na+ symporter|nr:bile acid:sodium symporter [Alphaproteobacteria bacterium]HAM47064.1 bile acid:sodium symporter [Alphaproteobacteria bacterium]